MRYQLTANLTCKTTNFKNATQSRMKSTNCHSLLVAVVNFAQKPTLDVRLR